MDNKDTQKLAEAVSALYDVVESLIATLEEKGGINMPIQQVASKMGRVRRKVQNELDRMTKD